MKVGICKNCGKIATTTCAVCGSTVCIQCKESYGCKVCKGKKQ